MPVDHGFYYGPAFVIDSLLNSENATVNINKNVKSTAI